MHLDTEWHLKQGFDFFAHLQIFFLDTLIVLQIFFCVYACVRATRVLSVFAPILSQTRWFAGSL